MYAINKINVFSQTMNKRVFAGVLWREKGKYFFEYDRAYQKLKSAAPLGPEFDLWKKVFSSKKLFASIADRIPLKENPAYPDYCGQWGISEDEDDVFVLLTTIGRRGPSTFVFEAADDDAYSSEDIKSFRKSLNLTQREFEDLFGINHPTMVRLEAGRTKNSLLFRYVEIFEKVPEAFDWLLKKRGQYLHDNKRVALINRNRK